MSDEQKKDLPQDAAAESRKEEPAAADEAVNKPESAAPSEQVTPAAAAEPAEAKQAEASAEAGEAAPAAQAEKAAAAPAEPKAEATDAPADAKVEPKAEKADDAQAKADAAAARAAARAARAAAKEPSDAPAAESAAPSDEEKEAKAKAAAEARAARANARAKKTEGEDDAPKQPSPNQPRLDQWVKILKEQIGDDAVEEAFINEKDGHLPYIIIKNEKWVSSAEQLRDHSEFQLNYLRNVSGIDQETHMEVAYHLLSLETKQELCVKIKTNRDAATIPSVTGVWPTANWNEREIYDLLGIDFPGHPDMRRIMMSDDWVGHPLRKDYEPLDPEV
ncbi:NADH-quinone oxidoreductase subunit C [Paenibacillus sp. NPDC056579]|uniref:NADH-quinone oxidoreductase subunit C n=1 Tax=Paenibacillus sp. NPDC056579 TaxID=3345871 RepID=UPI0036C391F5